MAYNVEGARKAGHSDAAIAEDLAEATRFNLAGARKAGHSDAAIIEEMLRIEQEASSAVIPGHEFGDAQARPEPLTIGEKVVGAGEAALTAATGATTGLLGHIAGTLKGLAESISEGLYGTQAGVRRIEQSAGRAAEALTYSPRTQGGQEAVRAVGAVAQALPAVLPTVGPAGAALQGVKATTPVAQLAARRVGEAAKQAAAPAMEAGGRAVGAVRAARQAVAPVAASPQAAGAEALRTAAIGGIGSKRAKADLAAQAALDPALIETAERRGVLQSLQPDHLSTNTVFRQLSQLVKSQTGSETKALENAGLLDFAAEARSTMRQMGGFEGKGTASSAVRDRMDAIHARLEKSEKAAWEELRAGIPPRTRVDVQNVRMALDERAADLGGVENLSKMEKAIASKLTKEEGATPTYGLVDDVRRDVGEVLGRSGPFKDANAGLAKLYYAALSEDQFLAAEARALTSVSARARAATQIRKGLEDDMQALFGRKLDKTMVPMLSRSIKKMEAGDDAEFAKMVASIPRSMRQRVVATGLQDFFDGTARGGEMAFGPFARWWDGLQKNPRSAAAIASSLPQGGMAALGDFAALSKSIATAKGEFLATGKAINPAALADAESMVRRVYEEVLRRGPAGLAAEGIGTVSGAPGLASLVIGAASRGRTPIATAADKLIASPEFRAAVFAQGRANAPKAMADLSQSPAMKAFVKASDDESLRADPSGWLTGGNSPATPRNTPERP